MNRLWPLFGLLWNFARLALLFLAFVAMHGVFEPAHSLVLLALASATVTSALLYLQCVLNPGLAPDLVLPLAAGGAAGFSLTLTALILYVTAAQTEASNALEQVSLSLPAVVLLASASLGDLALMVLPLGASKKKDAKDTAS